MSEEGEKVLDDVRDFLARFVAYPNDWAIDAHTLWIAHTWLMPAWESTPRLAFMSPEPGSGKSRALEVTEPLVPRAIHAVNCTPAYLFRKVADPNGKPTILYDEIDTVFGPKAKDNEDVRCMLNAGHRKGAMAGRCVSRGQTVVTEELEAYCAVALAGLDKLPDTIGTRSIVVRMKRRAPSEKVEPWRIRVHTPQGEELATRLGYWADSVADAVADVAPLLPLQVTDRNADKWEPLVIVADQAGERWGEAARVAAVADVAQKSDDEESLGVQLLRAVRDYFQLSEDVAVHTATLLLNLNSLKEAAWCRFRNGFGIDARGVANILRDYGIRPKDIRMGTVGKGYEATQFMDAWSRYLSPPKSATSATSATPENVDFAARKESA